MKARRRFILSVIGYWLLVIGYASYAQEETLTISTYYPSPYGVYKTLRLYPNTNNPLGGSCPQEGALSYNDNTNQIFLCNNAKKWQSLAGEEKYWTTTTITTGLLPPNDKFTVLHPRGNFQNINVGIGFPVNNDGTLNAPDFNAKLQVNGAIAGDTEIYSTNKASLISLNRWTDLIGNPGCPPPNPAVSYATLLGGRYGGATGEGATAIGGGTGGGSEACLNNAVVSNWARGNYSVAAGGDTVWVRGNFSVVSGLANRVRGEHSVVSGGKDNQIAVGNDFSTISGGQDNTVTSGDAATVSGGWSNGIDANGNFSTISGGRSNRARTFASVVSGGRDNIAGATYSWAGGRNMSISSGGGGNRTFAWGHSASLHPIADNDAFIIYSDQSPFRVEFGNPTLPLPSPTNHTDFFIYNLPPGTGDNLLYNSSTGQIFQPASSLRYKTNIRPIENALNKVKQLRGVYFNWKESGKPALGMIAEEVGKVIPEVVSYEANGQDARSLDYDKLVGLLVEAIREQDEEIAQIEQEIEELEKG